MLCKVPRDCSLAEAILSSKRGDRLACCVFGGKFLAQFGCYLDPKAIVNLRAGGACMCFAF